MTKKQLITWLTRIAYALQEIPAGHLDGAKTVSVIGISNFQRDIVKFRSALMKFCWAIQDNDTEEAEELIRKMESISVGSRKT